MVLQHSESLATRLANACGADRFSIRAPTSQILELVESDSDLRVALEAIRTQLGDQKVDPFLRSLVRAVFFIEPVNRSITSTKFATRWDVSGSFFDFDKEDPRWCSFEECFAIFFRLFTEIAERIQDPDIKALINNFIEHGLVSYELPIDYVVITDPDPNWRIHVEGNLAWALGSESQKAISLRAALESLGEIYEFTNLEGMEVRKPISEILKEVLRSKVEVKTYKTDRAQTGAHQTNREKRWEANVRSVQFAPRRECWGIEFTLLCQIVYFDGFPESIREDLISRDLVPRKAQLSRCPITREVLRWKPFVATVFSPVHGKSDFQVGHLNPLKSRVSEDAASGHSAANIAWISGDGNRIQGSLSLAETQALLRRIWQNYQV